MASQRFQRTCPAIAAMVAGLIAGTIRAQAPDDPATPSQECRRNGPIHRFFHHSAHTLHDKFIGDPANFVEPPLGSYIKEQFAMQVSKADGHRFILYRSDFLPGTDRFSPTGAGRFNLMYSRLPGWMGPVVVEWTPDQPAVAAARRQAVLNTLQRAGRPIQADRVVIGPSPYPGARGVEAINDHNNTVYRGMMPAQTYPLSPQATASGMSSSAGGQ